MKTAKLPSATHLKYTHSLIHLFFNLKPWWKKNCPFYLPTKEIFFFFFFTLKRFVASISESRIKSLWELMRRQPWWKLSEAYECVCVDVTVRAKKRAETALNAHWRSQTVRLQWIAIKFCLNYNEYEWWITAHVMCRSLDNV